METVNSIYGDRYAQMEDVMHALVSCIRAAAETVKASTGMNPVEHLKYRIKTEDSMREKCHRKGWPETTETARSKSHWIRFPSAAKKAFA